MTFETPAAAPILEEQAKIERAKAGPDIHCGFCGARNPSAAMTYRQCGADLTEGKAHQAGDVVGAYVAATDAKVKCTACGAENLATTR